MDILEILQDVRFSLLYFGAGERCIYRISDYVEEASWQFREQIELETIIRLYCTKSGFSIEV